MQIRIQDKNYRSLSRCYEGFDQSATLEEVEILQRQCIQLQKDFEDFSADFDKKYQIHLDKKKRIVASLAFAGFAVAAVLAIALHFIPVVNFTMATPLLVPLPAGVVLSLCGAASTYMSKTELEIASEFLKNIAVSLQTLKTQLISVRSNTAALDMTQGRGERKECARLMDTIIDECRKISAFCREAIPDEDE